MCYIYRYMKLSTFRFVCCAVALGCASAAYAAEFVWTGAAGSKWSDAANWTSGGAVATAAPGEADTALFDSTSCADCEIDAGSDGTVHDITVDSGYTGTISLSRELTVKNSFSQAGGVFTCADNDFTIGVFGAGGDLGKFTLSGGTFNCPSGDFRWRPIRTWDVGNFTVSGGTLNHNGGTLIVDWDHAYSNGMLGQTFIADNLVLNDLTIQSSAGGRLYVTGTNNVVNGAFVVSGNIKIFSSRSRSSLSSLVGEFVLKGDAEIAGVCQGGSLNLGFCGDEDQELYFSNESESSESRGFGMVVDKPAGKKVIVKAATKSVFLGMGTSEWKGGGNLGAVCMSGIYVKNGILDFSNVTNLQINSDNDAYFGFADGKSVLFPENVSHSMRISPKYSIANGLVFTNLSFYSQWNSPYFPVTATNSVMGRLRLDGATFATSSGDVEITSSSGWFSSGVRISTFAVYGDLEVANFSGYASMGGSGKILLCSEGDQTIYIRDPDAALPTLNVNKPSGSVICVPDDEKWPLVLASSSETANGGSFVIESGDVRLPKAGLFFANVHNQLFMRTGGSINIATVPLRIAHRANRTYRLYISGLDALGDLVLNGQVLTVYEAPLAVTGDLTLTRDSTSQVPYISSGTALTVELTGSGDQVFTSDLDYCAIQNYSGSSVNGGIGINKTAGRLICKSPLMARNITIADGQKIKLDIPATYEGAMIVSSRSLVFPGEGGETVFELTEKPRAAGYVTRDVFSYSGITGYDATAFGFVLPPKVSKAKLIHDGESKIISFSAKVSAGLSVILR